MGDKLDFILLLYFLNLVKKERHYNFLKKISKMPKTKTSSPKNLRIPKVILITAKIFAFISTKLVTRFAAKLFCNPNQT